MAKKCSGAVILEPTDLGSDAEALFVCWIRGRMPARALSYWVSEKLERSARLRSEPSSKPGQDIFEILSGSAFSFADRGCAVYEKVFAREVSDVIELAYKFMGLAVPKSAAEMDIGKANTLFRRLSLRSRWATSAVVISDALPSEPPVDLAILHIYMEVIRSHQSVLAVVHRSSSLPGGDLSDTMIKAELRLSHSELEADSACRSPAELLGINFLLEEYLLGLMKLKASASDFVYHLSEESSVYGVLGLDVSATDAEVRKAYRNLAMQHHPDKGGDRELFQTISQAYEKILEIRGIAKGNMDPDDLPEEREEKTNIVEKKSSIKPSSESPNDFFTRILKAAEECVTNAKLASELTTEALSQISCISRNEELVINPILLKILKCVKICAYTSLDASSLALQVASSMSAELMNCGFDALNIASNFPLTKNPDTSSIIIHLGQVTAKAVACASQITKLAKTIEASTSEPPDEKHKLIRQRIQNSQMLHKVNSEILQQQQIIYNSASLARICLVHHEFLRSTFIDWTRACLSHTETKVQGNILIRSVDLIVGAFREFLGLKECQGLAISANPLVRLWKHETVADRGFALPFIAREITPLLTRLATSRNRYRPESELAAEVWKALDLDIHQGLQLSLDV